MNIITAKLEPLPLKPNPYPTGSFWYKSEDGPDILYQLIYRTGMWHTIVLGGAGCWASDRKTPEAAINQLTRFYGTITITVEED